MTPVLEFSILDENAHGDLPAFPLKMTKIIVGPKAKNQDTLLSQVLAMLKIHKYQNSDCSVVLSAIDSFR